MRSLALVAEGIVIGLFRRIGALRTDDDLIPRRVGAVNIPEGQNEIGFLVNMEHMAVRCFARLQCQVGPVQLLPAVDADAGLL